MRRRSSRQSKELEYTAGEIGNRLSPTGCGRHTHTGEGYADKGPIHQSSSPEGEWSLATVEVKEAKANQSSLEERA